MALTAISSGQTVTGPTISPRDVVDDCGVMSQANVVSKRSSVMLNGGVAPVSGWGRPIRRAWLAIALVAASIFATSAFAAEYQYLNARTNPHWRTDLLAWLQKFKPTPDGVSIGITSTGDVHAYAVQGAFTGIYSIERLRHPVDRANPIIRSFMDGGTGRIIGFGRSKAAQEGVPQKAPTQDGQQGDNVGADEAPVPASGAMFDVRRADLDEAIAARLASYECWHRPRFFRRDWLTEAHLEEDHDGRTLQRLTPSRPLRLALLAFVAMLVLAAAILTNEGAQAQIMKPVGASGNTQSADKCPGSTFLVGFMVRYGDWLNAIGIICAPVDGAGNTGAQVPQPPSLRGGTGGSQPTPVTCAPNQVAVGVLIHLTSDGRRVRGIDLDCKPATANDLQMQRLGIMFSLGHNDTAAISQLCVPNNAISEVDINWGAAREWRRRYLRHGPSAPSVHCDAGDRPDATGAFRRPRRRAVSDNLQLRRSGRRLRHHGAEWRLGRHCAGLRPPPDVANRYLWKAVGRDIRRTLEQAAMRAQRRRDHS